MGRTVAELEAGMSNAEYVAWWVYFARQAQRQELELLKMKGGSQYG
jgi:hypothetical protein